MDVLHNIVLLINHEQVTDLGFAGTKKWKAQLFQNTSPTWNITLKFQKCRNIYKHRKQSFTIMYRIPSALWITPEFALGN